MPDTPQSFSQSQLDKLVRDAVEKERDRWKTETLEGKVTGLTDSLEKLSEQVDDNHKGVLKKLDEVNHFKEAMNKRLVETETMIKTGFDAADKQITNLMAAHTASPQHTLISDHLASTHLALQPEDAVDIKQLLLERRVREQNKKASNIFAKQLSMKATSAYAILGGASVFASAIVWFVTQVVPHIHFH